MLVPRDSKSGPAEGNLQQEGSAVSNTAKAAFALGSTLPWFYFGLRIDLLVHALRSSFSETVEGKPSPIGGKLRCFAGCGFLT